MKHFLLMVLLMVSLMLTGCGITNEEIIKQKNICLSGGMDYEIFGGISSTYVVMCVKPLSK